MDYKEIYGPPDLLDSGAFCFWYICKKNFSKLEKLNLLFQDTINKIIAYSPKLIGAILVLVIGLWLVNKLGKIVVSRLKKSSFSPELTSFLESLLGITLKVSVILMAAGVAGFNTSALMGMLAAAGFAVGLALQGGLGNFASGILILIFKPYKVGDWIEVEGKFGKVEEIQIFNTLLVTPGLKTLIIPNAQVTSHTVVNYSKKGKIRLEIMIGIPYEESFPRVKEIIERDLKKVKGIIKGNENPVGIESFESFFVKVGVKPYVHPDQYWDIFYEINAALKKSFHENNIKISYPETVQLGVVGE